MLRALNDGPPLHRTCLAVIVTGLAVLCLPTVFAVLWCAGLAVALVVLRPLTRAQDVIENERKQ